MLNEKRVKHMIRMAMYDKYESHDYNKMMHTTKKDYVSFRDMIGTAAGTVFYLLLMGGIAVALYTFFLDSVTRVVVILAVIVALIGYIVFLYLFRRFIHGRTLRKYSRLKRKVNRVKKDWEILERLYEEEADRAVPQALEQHESEA